MAILGYFLLAVSQVLNGVIWFLLIVFLIRCVISWTGADPYNPVVQFVTNVTEPILQPLRRRIPPLGMFDMSFFVAGLILIFLQVFLVNVLQHYGARFVLAGS